MSFPRLLRFSLLPLACVVFLTSRAHAQSTCVADINGDGVVDGEDLAEELSSWGPCIATPCVADLDANGTVDGADLTILLNGWGCTGTVFAPAIQSFSPSEAPYFGQGVITITGTNLLGTTEVLIGDLSCPSVTVLSPTTVTAALPISGDAMPALLPVSVLTPGGTAVAPVLFTFVEPTISTLPQFGPVDQTTQVTISASMGEFLTEIPASVYIEDLGQYATDVVVVDAQTITAVLPAWGDGLGAATVSLVVEQFSGKTQFSWRGINAFSYATLRYTVLDQLPDPEVITDASLRSAITATGQPWRVRDNVSHLEFVLIPPGSYTMGCTDPDAGCSSTGGFNQENPPHPVTITYPFYMARCEVSVQQYEAFTGQAVPNGGQIYDDFTPKPWIPHLPLTNIQWQDCKDWFLTPTKLRFANEAEWQYACKGGATLLYGGTGSPTISSCGNTVAGYPNGIPASETSTVYSELDCASADRVITGWNDLNSSHPGSPTPNSWSARPIGICPVSAPGVTSVANPLGLFDMQGNVQEWVEDWYTISTSSHAGWYATMPSVDPGPSPIQTPQYQGQKLQCGGAVRPNFNIGQDQSPVGSWVRHNSPVNNDTGQVWTSFNAANFNENWNDWAVGIRAVMDPQYTPSIQSVSPNAVDISGGTTITVTGANLAGSIMGPSVDVYIGVVAATNVVVVNQNTITATVPAGSVGPSFVRVVTDVGEAESGLIYLEIPAWAQVIDAEPNPSIVTNAAVRSAISETGLPWHVQDIATGIEMLLVPPGTYDMGCTASDAHSCFSMENPVHSVTISQPTYVGRYEVTQAQWTAVMGSNPSHFTAANGFPGSNARPVESVSWTAVQGFLSATGMRLPTEAEWEYACRAGTTTAFHGWPVQPAGTDDDTQVGNIAWYAVNALNGTQPVGTLLPNGFGLYDMAGNVSEWCSDWYSDNAYGSKPVVNPQGPASSPQGSRVLRGSNISLGVQSGPNYARSSCRDAGSPKIAGFDYGFRVVRNP